MYNVFVVSDGTGRTAIQALDAALTQFPRKHVEIYVKPGIRSKEQVQAIVYDAAEQKAIIVHTLVSDIVRSYMIRFARRNNVETIDLMGPLLMRLSNRLSNLPAEKPGLYHEAHKDYFRRIEAMEYTFRHDDGLRTHEIDKADIVILGVSRTFKTPLSIYLALKGLLVANIPIVLGMKLPKEIYEIDPHKVYGLTTYATRLSQLRKIRHAHLGGATGSYAEFKHVNKELNYALGLYQRQPHWSVIRVGGKAIEEIASEIMDIRRKSDLEHIE